VWQRTSRPRESFSHVRKYGGKIAKSETEGKDISTITSTKKIVKKQIETIKEKLKRKEKSKYITIGK
jgi:hypothetical protein